MKNKVTILGGVSQATNNDGSYIGSEVTDKTYEYIDIAQECAKQAFIAICKEGYRGFITIDVLVTKNNKTNEIKAYNIDPNARFSAGTMLLKNIHSAEKVNGTKIYGISYSNGIAIGDNIMYHLKKAMGNYSYNKNSKKLGIVPALINDVINIVEDRYYLKSVIIDTSYRATVEKFEKFKSYFRKL